MLEVSIFNGDITHLTIDVIVNAANSHLVGGGGVDGAIHRAAGPELLQACRKLNGCATGEAKITPAFRLPCRYIIHTVGPIWQGGRQHEAELLSRCYYNSLQLAEHYQLKSIAFSAISCGVYGYPLEKAVRVALEAIDSYFLKQQGSIIERVVLVAFNNHVEAAYLRAYAKLNSNLQLTPYRPL